MYDFKCMLLIVCHENEVLVCDFPMAIIWYFIWMFTLGMQYNKTKCNILTYLTCLLAVVCE